MYARLIAISGQETKAPSVDPEASFLMLYGRVNRSDGCASRFHRLCGSSRRGTRNPGHSHNHDAYAATRGPGPDRYTQGRRKTDHQ